MYFLLNHIPDLVVTLIGIALQWVAAVLILRNMEATRRDRFTRPVFLLALLLSFLLLFALS